MLDVPARVDAGTLLYWDRVRADRTRLVAFEILVDVAAETAEIRSHDDGETGRGAQDR